MHKIITRRKVINESDTLKDYSPLIRRIYLARGITNPQEISRDLNQLTPFTQLLNIQQAAERLTQAILQQEKIIIIGDFDVDGATSTTLAVSCLKAMGAAQVEYLIPNRFEYGYGLTPEIVAVAALSQPNLIITVDNGISSIDGVKKARSLGIDVLITDHHLPGKVIPEDCIIINPNQLNDHFPSKCLAGVGVIFYVMLSLRSRLQEREWFIQKAIELPNMAKFLDLVALGTVADLVPLDSNNRIMVYHGLRRIQAGLTRPGIMALLHVAGKEAQRITAADLGYVVGPRLNAAGRLDDMSIGIACLLAEEVGLALPFAKELNRLNQERRALETQMQQEAFLIVNQLNLGQRLPLGLCLYDPTWHQGVVGLVASRVKEKYNRPAIAFAKVDNENLKGSARSIKGLHIRDLLESIAADCPTLLSKFGGHAMAAGLSIPIAELDNFSLLFNQKISECLSEEDVQGRIETDGELQADEFKLENAHLLRQEGPWGQGFPEPLFDGDFQILDQQIVGKNHLKMWLQLPGSQTRLDAIAFRVDPQHWPDHRCAKIHAVYRLDVNEFNGRQRLQLILEEIYKTD